MMPRALIACAAALAGLALLAAPAGAQTESNVRITQFEMRPTVGVEPDSPSFTQAGGNPNVSLFMRFCGQGVPIESIEGNQVTTAEPHGVFTANTRVKITGRRFADQNGFWIANRTPDFNPTTFQLTTKVGVATGDTLLAPGDFVQVAPAYGCEPGETDEGERNSRLRDFEVHLPPGFLGNPTALPACPEAIWIAGACADNTILGHSVTETLTSLASPTLTPLVVPTEIYNVDTMGLRPALLGTALLGSTPPGPHPIAVTLRTTGDYGVDSAIVNIPKNLGGPLALITQIDAVLCAQVPCKAPLNTRIDAHTVAPLPGAQTRPFFRNPTSCGPKTPSLEAVSWARDPITDARDGPPFGTDGCERVPFDATLSVEPTETTQAGGAGSQQVAIDYGRDYADDPIWQSTLRQADVTLPDGLTLSPGGGNGLEACSFEQFGVDSAGRQVNDHPPACPSGSEIGDLSVETPVLPGPLGGKAFFGPVSAPGRPTAGNPWKLFLYIAGSGLRIKLVGDVDVSPSGQIHNLFVDQPELPFERLELRLRGGDRAILANPNDCETHAGAVTLTGWSGATNSSAPSVTPTGCADPTPFAPKIDQAGSDPQQAGANATSRIVISRADGQDDIKNLKLSLPVGAVGSLAAVPQCEIALAQAGNCPESTRVGTVETTVGTGSSLLTTSGALYLAQPQVPGDAAALAVVVPARAGPIDLGQVVVLSRVLLRPTDTGVDAVTSDIPNIFGGVPIHVRRIEITVDRPGFFLNPTGCDSRPLTATFTGYGGGSSTFTTMLNATGCEHLSFAPQLRLIAGARGQNAQLAHPPLKAIVTQNADEANIRSARVVLPDLLRPNSVQFNVPGGLCSDTEFSQGACPALSNVGTAKVTTPVLPFELSGPVYVVQEAGSVLPKLYVVLRGNGLEVVLRARNSFRGIRTVNTFEDLPDVPQSRFELNIKGGPNGILNNFYNACGVARVHRKYHYTFIGHNRKRYEKTTYLEQEGCAASSALGASIASRTMRVSRRGVGKLRLRCRASRTCKGRVTVRGKRVRSSKSFSIGARKRKSVRVKFSRKQVRRIRGARRLKARAIARVGTKSVRKSITLVAPRRR